MRVAKPLKPTPVLLLVNAQPFCTTYARQFLARADATAVAAAVK